MAEPFEINQKDTDRPDDFLDLYSPKGDSAVTLLPKEVFESFIDKVLSGWRVRAIMKWLRDTIKEPPPLNSIKAYIKRYIPQHYILNSDLLENVEDMGGFDLDELKGLSELVSVQAKRVKVALTREATDPDNSARGELECLFKMYKELLDSKAKLGVVKTAPTKVEHEIIEHKELPDGMTPKNVENILAVLNSLPKSDTVKFLVPETGSSIDKSNSKTNKLN
jgi:hypothetical protein